MELSLPGHHRRPQDSLQAVILAYMMPSPGYITFQIMFAVGYPGTPQLNTPLRRKRFWLLSHRFNVLAALRTQHFPQMLTIIW